MKYECLQISLRICPKRQRTWGGKPPPASHPIILNECKKKEIFSKLVNYLTHMSDLWHLHFSKCLMSCELQCIFIHILPSHWSCQRRFMIYNTVIYFYFIFFCGALLLEKVFLAKWFQSSFSTLFSFSQFIVFACDIRETKENVLLFFSS